MLSQNLVNTAMGRTPAELVIKNGQWVCVQTGEIIAGTDIAIIDGHIAYVGANADHTIGMQTQVLDAGGRYLVPGLLDAHMHVESGMVTISEFVRAVSPHGTTGMFVDPHEIANVFGIDGVKLMVDEAAEQIVHVYVQVPSCVPSAPGMETPGASISPTDVSEIMTWPGIIGLGEMMNFPGVINSDEKMHAEMFSTRGAGKTIGGHYASPDLGLGFHGYAAGGPEDDHEGTRTEDAIARARQGIKVMMRYGSSWHDVAEQVKAVTEHGIDPRHFLLCTDDCHAATLANEGHMDRVVRHAISLGLKPMLALQMATINSADHFGLSHIIGQIAPGRSADILFVDDLNNFKAQTVISKGKLTARFGKLLVEIPAYPYPDWAKKSVHLAQPIKSNDFKLFVESTHNTVKANVIGIIENQAPNHHLKLDVQVHSGEVQSDIHQDICKLSLLERHHCSGKIQTALVSGFGFTGKCAIGTTVAHDCHHMLIVGTDDDCMAAAANRLAETGGGQVVIKDGQIIGEVQLPIAGLMSNMPAEIVAKNAASVLAGFKTCGCALNSPNMQLALLALVVIPELRLSDMGLVDVTTFQFIPIFETSKGKN